MTHLDGRERPTGARSAPVPLPLAPFELATLGFSGPEKPCGAVGIPLDLPLDTRALSFHTSAMKVDFDGEGRSFAGEQVPEEVVWLGVRFRLERRVHANHALHLPRPGHHAAESDRLAPPARGLDERARDGDRPRGQ